MSDPNRKLTRLDREKVLSGKLSRFERAQLFCEVSGEVHWYHVLIAIVLPYVSLPWGIVKLVRDRSRSGLAMTVIPFIVAVFVVVVVKVTSDLGERENRDSDVTASSGGRNIHVIAKGEAKVRTEGEKIIVKLINHEIIIEPENVKVDGVHNTSISASVKNFEVYYMDRALRVEADGKTIIDGKFITLSSG